MYINYDPQHGLSIGPDRNDGYANNEVYGLVEDMEAEGKGSCPLAGALYPLEERSLGFDEEQQEHVKAIHALISDYKQSIVAD